MRSSSRTTARSCSRSVPLGTNGTTRHELLDAANAVLAFEVRDTGIGIAPRINTSSMFEAFQQADGASNRANTAAPASASPSRATSPALLGGDIAVTSEVRARGTFVLTLPRTIPSATSAVYAPAAAMTAREEARLPPGAATALTAPPPPARRVIASVPRSARASLRRGRS